MFLLHTVCLVMRFKESAFKPGKLKFWTLIRSIIDFYEEGNKLMKTISTFPEIKGLSVQNLTTDLPNRRNPGAIYFLQTLPIQPPQTGAASDFRPQTEIAETSLTRGSFVMTPPPHPVAHSPGERWGTGSCSAGPRRRRSAPGTRWSCSESRRSPPASRFPGRRSAWLPGSQRRIPEKRERKKEIGTTLRNHWTKYKHICYLDLFFFLKKIFFMSDVAVTEFWMDCFNSGVKRWDCMIIL